MASRSGYFGIEAHLARFVFDVPKLWAMVGLLFAACPTGINAYLFAARNKTGEAVASASVSLSTSLAAIGVIIWLAILGFAT